MNRLKDPKISIIALLALVLLVLPLIFLLRKDADPAPSGPTVSTTLPVDLPLARGESVVGICLPSQTDWTVAGNKLQAQLLALGYQVKLVYGDGSAQTQSRQMLELIEEGANCLVVAPVDSFLMAEAADAALAKKVPIVSYGSLFMDTEAAAGYVCYDYRKMGKEIAEYVASKLNLATAKEEQRLHTAELFMGSPDDYNAMQFYSGVMSVLEPYLAEGVLEIKSRRTTFESCCIWDWSKDNAKKECIKRLENSYGDTAPDVCICASDNIAAGVITALEEKGKTSLVTGNGNTKTGKDNMFAGKQALTVSTTLDETAVACGAMVDWALFGAKSEVVFTSVSNNAVTVPTALCGFTLIKND
jgi:putative multiple sugar transport system substrate-binding protein